MEIKTHPFPVSLHSLSSTLPPELLPRVQNSESSSAANAHECGEEQPLGALVPVLGGPREQGSNSAEADSSSMCSPGVPVGAQRD